MCGRMGLVVMLPVGLWMMAIGAMAQSSPCSPCSSYSEDVESQQTLVDQLAIEVEQAESELSTAGSEEDRATAVWKEHRAKADKLAEELQECAIENCVSCDECASERFFLEGAVRDYETAYTDFIQKNDRWKQDIDNNGKREEADDAAGELHSKQSHYFRYSSIYKDCLRVSCGTYIPGDCQQCMNSKDAAAAEETEAENASIDLTEQEDVRTLAQQALDNTRAELQKAQDELSSRQEGLSICVGINCNQDSGDGVSDDDDDDYYYYYYYYYYEEYEDNNGDGEGDAPYYPNDGSGSPFGDTHDDPEVYDPEVYDPQEEDLDEEDHHEDDHHEDDPQEDDPQEDDPPEDLLASNDYGYYGEYNPYYGEASAYGDPHVLGLDGKTFGFNGDTTHKFLMLKDRGLVVTTRLVELYDEAKDRHSNYFHKLYIRTCDMNLRIIAAEEKHNNTRVFLDSVQLTESDGTRTVGDTTITFRGLGTDNPAVGITTSGYKITVVGHPFVHHPHLDMDVVLLAKPVEPEGLLGSTSSTFEDVSAEDLTMHKQNEKFAVTSYKQTVPKCDR